MTVTLSSSTTKILFKLAAGLSVAYFLLRMIVPPAIFLLQYPYQTIGIGGPVGGWLNANSLWLQGGYGIGSPLLVIMLALVAVGLVGLPQKLAPGSGWGRRMLLFAFAATLVMVLASIVFALLSFPNPLFGTGPVIPDTWNSGLAVLFGITAILSVLSYAGLAVVLVKQRLLTVWSGIALAVGICILSVNWFSLSFANDMLSQVSVIFLLGLGWSVGLWRLGDAATLTQPFGKEVHQFPKIRYILAGIAVVLVLWVGGVAAVYAWEARDAGALCPGSQDVHKIDDSHSIVTQHSPHFSFTYTVSPQLPWRGGRWNASPYNQGRCAISTFSSPDWVNNRAIELLPVDQYWLEQTFAPKSPAAIATFSVNVTTKTVDSIQALQTKFEQARADDEKLRQEGKINGPSYNINVSYKQTALDGHPALMGTSIVNGGNANQYSQQVFLISGEQQYEVGWVVNADNPKDRDAFVQAHRDELEKIVQSFKLH